MSRWVKWVRCLPWKSRGWHARTSTGIGCWSCVRSPRRWSSTRMAATIRRISTTGLLLGLKGTMAQAELHFLRARLQGGKLNKAKKGELRFPLPVGYCYDEQGCIVPDPDEEVRGAV